jgi:hypothetical protein
MELWHSDKKQRPAFSTNAFLARAPTTVVPLLACIVVTLASQASVTLTTIAIAIGVSVGVSVGATVGVLAVVLLAVVSHI